VSAARVMGGASSGLTEQFGAIDIYLFDQLLRGRLAPGSRVVDAGCGHGRNLVYLLQAGFEVYGADVDADAIQSVQHMAQVLAPQLDSRNFRLESIEAMSFHDAFADTVICNTVLHFARDDQHFRAMLDGSWRVLRPGGVYFARLASNIGMESRMQPLGGRRFLLPDGSERYLVDEALLLEHTERIGGRLLDPLKTTIVQDQRCMTTWVMRKDG
jgi:SAM-dependent methyltransferase